MREAPALVIEGEFIAAGRETIPVVNPATGLPCAELPVATETDIELALQAVARGFDQWRHKPAVERAAVLHKAAALMRERAGAIAAATVRELGSPLAAARFEAMVASNVLDWSAGEARRIYGRTVPSRFPGVRQIVQPEPVGPVFAACPWNMPVIFPARKMAEALAAGCSLIIKPAEETPTPAVMVHEALLDAGLPADVVSTVFGVPDMISRKVLGSGVVRKLSFTGSVPVGRHLAGLAAEHLVKSTLELGGHAPTLVFGDVEVAPVARMLAGRKARNSGQVCNSPTRFYVHADIYARFRDEFAGALEIVKIGDPAEQTTQMGPLVNEKRLCAIESFVEDGRRAGASVVTGGKRIGNRGFFHELTLLDDVPDNARVMHDEPFGPLAAMQPFHTLDEVIEKSNRLPFGLAAYAFTSSRRVLDALSSELQVGLLGLNHCDIAAAETPFGGMKDSGYGAEGGSEGIEGYLVTKFVSEASPVGQ